MNLIEVMKENKYDDEHFFSQYAQMSRSVEGLQGAGEWHILQKMLPDFTDKSTGLRLRIWLALYLCHRTWSKVCYRN